MPKVVMEKWVVVKGNEADDWGIRREHETSGMSVAQMLWEADARHIVELHNSYVLWFADPCPSK